MFAERQRTSLQVIELLQLNESDEAKHRLSDLARCARPSTHPCGASARLGSMTARDLGRFALPWTSWDRV